MCLAPQAFGSNNHVPDVKIIIIIYGAPLTRTLASKATTIKMGLGGWLRTFLAGVLIAGSHESNADLKTR